MRFIRFNGSGGNEVVSIESASTPEPGVRQVLVASRYAGLNPADILQRNGNYPVPADAPQDVPGLEVAGEIAAVGPLVQKWRVGDRVMGIVGGGGLADHVVAEEAHLWRAPDAIDNTAAAALPEAVLTAFDALQRARVTIGDTVVIRGINGGVGLAAAQIARAIGAAPIGIGRTNAALEKVSDLLSIPTHRTDHAADAVDTAGGADAIIELVGGEHVADDLGFLKPRGRIVVVSTSAGTAAQVPLNLLMARRADLMGTVLRGRSHSEKGVVVANLEQQLAGHLGRDVNVPVDRVFPAQDIATALDHLEQPGKVGKVLLDFGS